MKNQRKEYVVGDVLTVEFVQNRKGGKPVCRVGGKIGFVSNKEKLHCKEGESWTVAVSVVNPKCVEVALIDRIRTVEENEQLLRIKLKELAKKESEKHTKRKKQKIHYPYKSKQERRN